MAHIKRINEMVKVNENVGRDYSADLLEKLLYNGDLSIRILDRYGKSNYKHGEMIEYARDFFLEIKGMQETCNGYNEVRLGDSNMTYTVNVYDENGEMYASIDFQFVYFNTDLVETVQKAIDNAE